MRSIIIAGIIFIWLILGYAYFLCSAICRLSPNVDVREFSLRFSANDEVPVIGQLWSEDVMMIANDLQKHQILEINGKYYSEEKNNTHYDNLGQARAESVANLLNDYVDSNQIITNSTRLEGSVPQESFPSIAIRKYNIIDSKERNEVDSQKIYFPFNSSEAIDPTVAQQILSGIKEKIQESGERIMLTGHTDSIGPKSYNNRLGMMRAVSIEQILLDKGIDENRIITLTKGELNPVADNSSAEGRADNRRTIVRVIK